MTTAVSETINEVEVFCQQARDIRVLVRSNVDGLTHEESLIQPRPGGNCLNWVMGHLLYHYELMLPLLDQERVVEEGALDRYARGSAPLKDPAEALAFEDLLAAWDEAVQRVDAGLADLTLEALDRPVPSGSDDDADETVRSFLTAILLHQAYHAGQTGLLRRIAGKDGAIR